MSNANAISCKYNANAQPLSAYASEGWAIAVETNDIVFAKVNI